MKYLSICSGIEAATVAWHPLGWQAVAFAEIEKFPSAVLKHHWPDVPNLGDMTRFREWPESVFLEADCIIAGTPCQAFSVAGRRRSLEDERGNLTLTFTRIIDHARTIRIAAGRPEAIILWENVPGCLSTKDNAFGCFLSELSGEDVTAIKKWPAAGRVLGEKRRVAWRIIDAQFAGVPQRRRRVFCVSVNAQAVADSRTASPEQILFIGQSLRGDIAKGKEEEPAGAVAPAISKCLKSSSGGIDREDKHTLITEPIGATASHLSPPVTTGAPFSKTGNSRVEAEAMVVEQKKDSHDEVTGTLCADTHPGSYSGQDAYQNKLIPQPAIGFSSNMSEPDALEERTPPQKRAGGNAPAVAQVQWSSGGGKIENDTAQTLRAGAEHNYQFARINQTVRRLTPVECERLQGFPDNHTRIPWRGKPAEQCPDGSRYKALGNSMAVPVIRWLGQRIQAGSELTE